MYEKLYSRFVYGIFHSFHGFVLNPTQAASPVYRGRAWSSVGQRNGHRTGNGGGADKNRLFLEFWSSSSLSLRQVESSSGDERWNRRVESDASVAPSPTTVAASEEAPLLEGHGIQVAPGTARSRSQRSQRSPHRLPSLSQPPGSKSLRLRATKLPEAQSLPSEAKRKADGSPETDSDGRLCVICQARRGMQRLATPVLRCQSGFSKSRG